MTVPYSSSYTLSSCFGVALPLVPFCLISSSPGHPPSFPSHSATATRPVKREAPSTASPLHCVSVKTKHFLRSSPGHILASLRVLTAKSLVGTISHVFPPAISSIALSPETASLCLCVCWLSLLHLECHLFRALARPFPCHIPVT